jgi:hypothetical protein
MNLGSHRIILRKLAEETFGPLVPLGAVLTVIGPNQRWNGEELAGTAGNTGGRDHENGEIVIPAAVTHPSKTVKNQ